jgi:hypothetical protein
MNLNPSLNLNLERRALKIHNADIFRVERRKKGCQETHERTTTQKRVSRVYTARNPKLARPQPQPEIELDGAWVYNGRRCASVPGKVNRGWCRIQPEDTDAITAERG